MTPDGRLALGVIGCGHWGPNHIRALASLPELRVTWAVDRSEDRRRHIAALYDRIRVTSSSDEALDDASLDAVVVATPASTHKPLVLAALRAGKHVLCEKPLALSSAECLELIDAAALHGVVLMIGHVFLFNAGIQKLGELIRSGELGSVYYAAAARTNLGPIRKDANAAYDLAVHEISIFNFLLGSPPVSVSACGRSYLQPGVEDVVFVTLSYPGQIFTGITASWLSPKKIREITVVGDRKMATWNDLASGSLAIYDQGVKSEPYYDSYGEFQLLARDGDVTIPRIDWEEPLRRQARFFVESIRNGTATICSGERGLDVVRTLEAIAESMLEHGAPVPVASARSVERRAAG